MLLHYMGAKVKAGGYLYSLFPADYYEYREPFCGNASLLDHVPICKSRWINDIDTWVYNYLVALRDDENFIDELLDWKSGIIDADSSHAAFMRAKTRLVFDGDPVAYVVVNRHAYGQFVRPQRQNCASYDNNKNGKGLQPISRERCERAKAIMQGVKITRGDYSVLLDDPGENTFLFLDPPYYVSDSGDPLYEHVLSYGDHLRLADQLRSCKHKFLLTIGYCELTHHLYVTSGDFEVMVRDQKNIRVNSQRPPGSDKYQELIVCNYDPCVEPSTRRSQESEKH